MMPQSILRKKSPSLLEESAGEDYGSTSETTSTRSTSQFDSFTQSSPPILEPSKDQSRSAKPSASNDGSSPPIDPWATLVTTSCNEPMMTRPVTYKDPPIDQQVDEEEEKQILPDRSFRSPFMRGYSDATSKFKNSNFMYAFQVLVSIIPVSAIAMGLIFWNQCSVSKALPLWGAMLGAYDVVFIVLWIIACYFISSGRSILEFNICVLMTLATVVLFTFTEMCIFFATSVSFDEKSDSYCDRTFYYYAFWKQIATCVAVFLSFMLYLPNCILRLTCC